MIHFLRLLNRFARMVPDAVSAPRGCRGRQLTARLPAPARSSRSLCAVATAILMASPLHAQSSNAFDWTVYMQTTATRPSGAHSDFDVNRTRVVLEHRKPKFRNHLQFELAADDRTEQRPGLLPEVVFALFTDYKFAARQTLRVGQFKTPVGMDFQRPASDLETIPRGMEAGLILHRDTGIMLSGRRFGRGFGYDVGIFNPAARSAATAQLHAQVGHTAATALRGVFDNDTWHLELSTGRSSDAGGDATATYRVHDLGIRFRRQTFNLEFEWIEGSHIRGNRARDEHVYFVHAARALTRRLELVGRLYAGESTISGGSTKLRNTHLGATMGVFDTARMHGRLQANFIHTGGDSSAYTGLRGYRSDTLLLEFQVLTSR